MEKVCAMCKANLSLAEFNAKQSKCKKCQVIYNRHKRQQNRESIATSSIHTEERVKGWLAEQNASEVDITERLLDADKRDAQAAQVLESLLDIKNDLAVNRACVMQISTQLDKITARLERNGRFTRALTLLGVAAVGKIAIRLSHAVTKQNRSDKTFG
jgi:hypothetical protein